MKEKKNICGNCGYYRPLYTKKDMHFNKEKAGKCYKHRQIKECEDTCVKWRSNSEYCYGGNQFSNARVLRGIFFRLSAIRQILQEEQDAGKS